ncbi:hypothetical protein M8494_11710 [Serratia ureilytica]
MRHAPPLPLAELAHEAFILYRRPAGGLYDAILAASPPRRPAHRAGSAAPAGHPQPAAQAQGCSGARCGGWAATASSTAPSAPSALALPRCAAALRRSSSAFVSWC